MTSKKNLESIREELVARMQELEREFANKESFADDTVQDAGDQAMSSTMESLQSSLQDSQMEEFRRIASAIKMIEDGSYGICSDCGEPIAEKRLKSFPNAIRCLVCQELFEESGSLQ